MSLGDANVQAQHPFVLSANKQVFIVWKTFDGETTNIQLIHSRDNGKSWSKPDAIAHTREGSDHPFLITDGQHSYLSWHTVAEGYRLIPLKPREDK